MSVRQEREDGMGEETRKVVTLKADGTRTAVQGMPQFFGISGASAGARHISMNLTAFPPGGCAKVHYHRDYETAIYGLSGRIALCYGKALEEMCLIERGIFCFIPPALPHVAFNLSDTEPAEAITARNDPVEQENVVLTPELEPLVEGLLARQKTQTA